MLTTRMAPYIPFLKNNIIYVTLVVYMKVVLTSREKNISFKTLTTKYHLEHVGNVGRINVKLKFFLCLIKHHAMKTYWGGGIAPCIFYLATGRR
jgi:hypothetical protein